MLSTSTGQFKLSKQKHLKYLKMSNIWVNFCWPVTDCPHTWQAQPQQDTDASVSLLELMMPSVEVNVEYNQRSCGKSSQ